MEKKAYDLPELAYKWQQGTITPGEKAYFDQWYASFSDEELLLAAGKFNDREQLRLALLHGLNSKIDAAQAAKPVKVMPLWRKIAAVAAAVLLFGVLVLLKDPLLNLFSPVAQLQVTTRPGEYRQLRLADGTQVWLSPSSKVSYPEHFRGPVRSVSISGEAFFDVRHDHPFIIVSGRLKTTVLGTSFDVQAYPGHPSAEITVVSGKVGVSDQLGTSFIVAGQRAVYSKSTGTLAKENYPEASKFLQSRLGIFEYRGVTLSVIANDLETRYGVRIRLAPDILKKCFYGELRFSDPLSHTLDNLATVMEIKWRNEAGAYFLQPLSSIK